MNIKRATVDDAEEILALQKLSYVSEAEIYNDFSIQPLHQNLNEIESEFKEQQVLKYVVEGKIVGSVRYLIKDGTCYINKLIVHPKSQNQGIGSTLLKEVQNHSKIVNRFELFTGFKSEKNIHLYEKQGFKIFRYEKINDNLTLVFMEKHAESK